MSISENLKKVLKNTVFFWAFRSYASQMCFYIEIFCDANFLRYFHHISIYCYFMTTLDNDIKQKNSYKFNCKTCDYGTSRKHNMDIHLLSAKHQKLANDNGKLANDNGKLANVSKYCCKKCDKIYNDRAGLWRHNKKCITKLQVNTNNNEHSLLLEILKQNQDYQQLILQQQTQIYNLTAKSSENI